MFLKLAIPPSTKETAPVRNRYDIGRALVKGIKVTIPDGHKYLTHLELLSQGRPIFTRGERYITGNLNEVVFNDPVILDGPPYDVTLSGWNEDDTFTHSFYVEVI